jgi:hypothetical protein
MLPKLLYEASITVIPKSNKNTHTKKENYSQVQWHTPVILAIWEVGIRRITVRGQPGQKVCKILISKITRTKWTGDVAQVIVWLIYKHEALSSNLSDIKKINKNKKL